MTPTTKTAMPRQDDDRIQTLHPEGKQGVRIERAKYEPMRRAILAAVPRRRAGISFEELKEAVRPHLAASGFPREASVNWYLVTVKQDLEARGTIERVPGVRPQHLRRP